MNIKTKMKVIWTRRENRFFLFKNASFYSQALKWHLKEKNVFRTYLSRKKEK